MKNALAAVAVLVALPLLHAPSASAAGGGPTCRGLQATHVGSPGELLITTPGPDVVVSNGARAVRTLNGDDVICVTRSRDTAITITPGGGDDLVDATRVEDAYIETFLGAIGVDGSSGDDVYLGGPAYDGVRLASGTAGDDKRITTGGGEDYVTMYEEYPGDVKASLGRGKDSSIVRQRAGVEIDAGAGRDDLTAYCEGCRTARYDLRRGAVRIDGAPGGRAAGFEVLEFDTADLGLARHVSVIGNDADNWIVAYACRGEVRGGPGDDDVYTFAQRSECDGIGAEITGGPGDDYLYGTEGRDYIHGRDGDDEVVGNPGGDLLVGGPGRDLARGGQGEDRCRAETTRRCER